MELSKRLLAVASLVTPGKRIADIGTDHAYIPIYLIEENRCVSAVAMDVNRGPLQRAEEHVQEAGLQKKVELRLSDGMEKLKPYEVESIVIAGMGGGLVMNILSAYPEVTCSLEECILQPQSEIAKVRYFLLENKFTFVEEEMVLDDGKYYPMMKVIPPEDMVNFSRENTRRKETDSGSWTETELRYGKLLLEKKHPVLKEFLLREYTLHKKILENLEGKNGEKIELRRKELEEDIEYIEKGLEYYAV